MGDWYVGDTIIVILVCGSVLIPTGIILGQIKQEVVSPTKEVVEKKPFEDFKSWCIYRGWAYNAFGQCIMGYEWINMKEVTKCTKSKCNKYLE